MNITPIGLNDQSNPFESIRHTDESGCEFWYARELMPLLEYKTWRRFKESIDRAIIACENSGFVASDHFANVGQMQRIGDSSATRLVTIDVRLTRYSCYLIAMNGDPRKEAIAQAQSYFATKAHDYHVLETLGLAEHSLTMSKDLVSIYNGQLVTDSLTLANFFGKEHKYILREIGAKMSQSTNDYISNFYRKHLIKCSYFDTHKREQTKYLLTREGFSLIALGFTGEKAELFKIQYIEAFEEMTKQLRGYALAHFFRDTTNKQLVYVIRNTVTGLLKIGVTNNITRRINQLECATGCELETVFCSVVADNAKEIERDLHNQFADFRQRGEWFNVDVDLVVNAISKMAFTLETTTLKIAS